MISRDTKPEGDSAASKPGTEETGGGQTPDTDADSATSSPKEIGGRKGPDPTRFGDWEKGGRCIDF